jgi:MscS family membrane protein
VYLLVLPVASFLAQKQINVTGSAATLLYYVFFISYGVTLVWMVWLSANQVADAIISSSPRVKAGSLNASLFKLISRSVGIVAVLVLVFQILNEVGVPVYGLVTGAGIGGIAIALAAKSTLENFMGALNLFADRPVSIGDLCR